MLIYLDTAIVIYSIDGDPAFQVRSVTRLDAAKAAGHDVATSDLTRLECLVVPLRSHDAALQAVYLQFLNTTTVLPLPPGVYDMAAEIRAKHRYSTTDSLHLAVAKSGGCDLFLTNDRRLAGFSDIAVEILP